MVPPSEYLFLPLIMLACLLLQPFFIPPQIKAWRTKLNLSNRSGDKRHPWMVGLRSSYLCSHPGLRFQWPPHVKLGHSVIVLYVRANPKRNAWFKPRSSAVRQEDQFSPNTPICLTSVQKRFNFSQAWLGGFQCVHSARSQRSNVTAKTNTFVFPSAHRQAGALGGLCNSTCLLCASF